jgi:aminoglycoside phosphotransferase (APT) family kinase protein
MVEWNPYPQDFDFGHAGDWAYTYPLAEQNDVICHNDFASYNMILRDNLAIGIVDFDLAGPGLRMRDLAYLAYWFAPLSFSSKELAERSASEVASGDRRLKLLCATYGTSDYAGLLDMLFEVIDHMSSESTVMKMIDREAATKRRQGGHFEHWKREAIAFDKSRSAIWRNLG